MKRKVDAYGYVTYNTERFYVGEEFALESIFLCINPSCLGHMCAKSHSMTGIVNSESNQSIANETSKEIVIQDTLIPNFCSYVLRSKSKPFQVFKNESPIQQPIRLLIGRFTSIFLRNNYLALSFNTSKSFKERFSSFVFINKVIHYFSQKFNSFIHNAIIPGDKTNSNTKGGK